MAKVRCVCKNCGGEFFKFPSDIKKGEGNYCSWKCRYTPRELIIKKDHALVPLTQGKFAIIDLKDVEEVGKYNWQAHKQRNGIIYATARSSNGSILFMHRIIMNAKKGEFVDHKKIENTLDNRKENLRICTKAQNCRNKRKLHKASSKFKGVYWNKINKKYHVVICKNYKYYYLGYFDDEIEAAKTYDAKAIELFGEFANTNF